jgi:isopropylmalate/homocitrate/citramalate synthase
LSSPEAKPVQREFTFTSPYNPSFEGSRVRIYDSTLRDGEQMPGVAFSVEDKVAVARALDAAGVPEVEAGFPSVSDTEFEAIKAIVDLDLDSDVSVLCRCCEPDLDRARRLDVDLVMMFIATSDIHIRDKLRTDRAGVADQVSKAIDYCCEHAIPFSFSTEDTTRSELGFVKDLNWMAAERGARRVGITDTVGCATPEAIAHIVGFLREELPCHLSVHLHNDMGLATANAVSGVMAGATHVSTTVNGIGERAGNVPLQEFVLVMEALYNVSTGVNLARLTELSRLVSRLSKVPLHPNQPITGANAFAHESGIHVAAVYANPFTYEPIAPEAVGNERRIVMGKHTGHRAVRTALAGKGVTASEEQVEAILLEVKSRGQAHGSVGWDEFWDIAEAVTGDRSDG